MAKSNVKTTKKSTAKKATTKTTAKKSNLNAATQKKTTKKTTTPTKKATTKAAAQKKETATTKATATKQQKFMLRKNGLDKEGNQKFTAVRVYDRKPNGWKEIEGATTAPVGYKWVSNNKSLFSGQRKTGLLKLKDK